MSSLLNLVEELLSLNDESLIERVVNTNDVQGCLEELCAILNDEQQAQGNDPLTLEQLREMDGEPVYIVHKMRGNGWSIVQWHGIHKSWMYYSQTGTGEGMTATPISAKDYGDTWLAYRHKLEEADHVYTE